MRWQRLAGSELLDGARLRWRGDKGALHINLDEVDLVDGHHAWVSDRHVWVSVKMSLPWPLRTNQLWQLSTPEVCVDVKTSGTIERVAWPWLASKDVGHRMQRVTTPDGRYKRVRWASVKPRAARLVNLLPTSAVPFMGP